MSLLYKIDGNYVTPMEGVTWDSYKHFRRLIVDGKLPIKKPIGFKLESPSGLNVASAVQRNALCAESVVSIATAVKNLIFAGDMNSWVKSGLTYGATYSNTPLTSKDGKPVLVVDKSVYMYTAIEDVCISFFVKKAEGYQSMDDNAKYMEERVSTESLAFFPLHTYHCLGEHVYVYPYTKGDTRIRVRYAKGMTAAIFDQIMEEAYMNGN